jgi:hypothetical protein
MIEGPRWFSFPFNYFGNYDNLCDEERSLIKLERMNVKIGVEAIGRFELKKWCEKFLKYSKT